jgi:hypothetical protein
MDRQRSMRTRPLLCDPAGDDGQRSDEQAAYPAPYRLAQAALPRSSRSPTSKGYRFKGRAVIHEPGAAAFAEGIERMRADGSKLTGRVKAIVVIEVQDAAPLVSPAYDDGTTTEAEMLETQRARFARLHERHVRKTS